MVIAEYDIASGTALLLAAAPNGKSRLIDAASVLPALAAVPPPSLTGAAASTVVELADPVDPQTVLTRLRAAAATPGPLFVCVAGQLHLDQKQKLPHLALARTTPSTVRYTGLPWHWLVSELGARAAGTTTVVADLVADATAFQRLGAEGLTLGPGIDLYGHVAPPPRQRRTTAAPVYLQACAAVWREGGRPPFAEVHELAVAQAAHPEALLLTAGAPLNGSASPNGFAPPGPGEPQATAPAPAPETVLPAAPAAPVANGTADANGTAVANGSAAPAREEVPDPHPAILAAAHAGRHGEAAAIVALWESAALRTHGAGSAQAVHWLEVRADLARIGGDPARSCELWMAAADARLALQQPPEDPEVRGAADRAHHQWTQVQDPARARELGDGLLALRDQVPGAQPGALRAIRQRMESLGSASAAPR
ncbi:hypothetical protein GCM10009801_63040 [Streptomyces albiaxialis]|uniref:Uncharacterized protein n=1 Tax=Streptomyces albiaxialis TaxID=329523 RepID=A0ABN2WL55_9ACTN